MSLSWTKWRPRLWSLVYQAGTEQTGSDIEAEPESIGVARSLELLWEWQRLVSFCLIWGHFTVSEAELISNLDRRQIWATVKSQHPRFPPYFPWVCRHQARWCLRTDRFRLVKVQVLEWNCTDHSCLDKTFTLPSICYKIYTVTGATLALSDRYQINSICSLNPWHTSFHLSTKKQEKESPLDYPETFGKQGIEPRPSHMGCMCWELLARLC